MEGIRSIFKRTKTNGNMLNKIKKWLFRTWGDWEVLEAYHLTDSNYNKTWRIVTTMKRVSNDGLIQYKTIRNYNTW